MFLFNYARPSIILLAAAVVPAILILLYVYKKDKNEREPWGLLFQLLGFGAVTTACASLTETWGSFILEKVPWQSERSYYFWMMFFVVAVSEEGFKWLALRLRTWKNPNFNCTFDAVVYAVFVSLGFAILENIKYVFAYGFTTAIVRAITAVPGHACFGIFMGVFYGEAKKRSLSGNKAGSALFNWLAVLVPIFLHGLYDYCASVSKTLWFIVLVLVIFLAAFIVVKKASKKDERIQ